MSRGQHAADDNSFRRSASGALMRGVVLVVVAVVIGIILLQATDDPVPLESAGGNGGGAVETTTTTAPSEALPTITQPPVTALDPSTITVLVANGAGVAGLAGDVTDIVAKVGFETAAATDVRSGADAETSTVYYTPGFEEAASAVADAFEPVPPVAALPDPPPVGDLAGANVVVVAASDIAP